MSQYQALAMCQHHRGHSDNQGAVLVTRDIMVDLVGPIRAAKEQII